MVKERYKIIRYYFDKRKKNKIMKRNLTFKQARAHCSSSKSRGKDWFDGFKKQ